MSDGKGVLVFWSPFHDPRVHHGAPEGVHVTTVHALDESAPGRPVAYSLLDVKDSSYFHLNHITGNMTTARPITRKVGDKYEVIVAAVSQGVTEVKTMQVEVTVPNEYPPRFEHSVYRAEVHKTRMRPGHRVLQVRAHDTDPVPYNAEVYYRLAAAPKSISAYRYLALDGITGEVVLNRSLADVAGSMITFTVIAEDGGSPKKQARARVEILVKTISDPQNTRAIVANETSVRFCWQRPLHGNVSGYVVMYREVAENDPSFVNVTTGAADECVPVHGLRPWTDYEYRVHAWNSREEGIGSPMDRFATRIDYCLLNVCKHGSCETTGHVPGYRCLCDPGYYGDACEHFNPCSEQPCKTFGTCVNTSHGEYRCDCFTGFSGRNCSDFDPCLLKPSACLHNGVCQSNASHTFTCLCVDGYYGKTCHQYDPCFPSPCRHGARCLNESDVKFTCQCLPGYAGDFCEKNINECLSSPCMNRGECEDGVNGFTCHCPPGFGGLLCELRDYCPEEFQQTDKGAFHWQSVAHGSTAKVECPYGAYNPASEHKHARRRCRLLPNGQTGWMKVSAQHCRYKTFQAAENITSELELLTHDPSSIRPDQLQSIAEKIEPVVDYAIKDIKIAQAMIHVISNFLALNDIVIKQGDANGMAVEKLVSVVERFTSKVVLGPGGLIIENENLVVKAVAWSPKLILHGQDFLSFFLRSNGDHYLHDDFSGDGDEQDDGDNIVITIPFEALSRAINSSLVAAGEPYRPFHEVEKGPRIAFVSYRNDKFFRPVRPTLTSLISAGQVVLSAKIGDSKIENLTNPLVYSYPTYSAKKYVCAFWDDHRKEWSTAGVTTNRSGNVTVCSSTHMTAFSLLLRRIQGPGIPAAVVGTCLAIDLELYRCRDDHCVLFSRNPFIYYLALLGIPCFILFLNLVVFIMVTRVLFKQRMAGATKSVNHTSESRSGMTDQVPVTADQVRGAFAVMTLLGVTWIFGVFAVGEARTVFQYVFCACNSMQGFLIFVVRVFQRPEARAAWLQLVTTDAFKKHRGSEPPKGSWCANSNAKQNSQSSAVQVTCTTTDGTSTVVFNSNILSKGRGGGTGATAVVEGCPTKQSRFSGVGSLLCSRQKDGKKSNAGGQYRKEKSSKAIAERKEAKDNHAQFYSCEEQASALVPNLYAGQQQQLMNNSPSACDPLKYIDDYSRSSATLCFNSNQKTHSLFAYVGIETVPIRINGVVHSPVEEQKAESFTTFQRPSPVPSIPEITDLPQSWNTSVTAVTEPHNVIVSGQEPIPSSTLKSTSETSFLMANEASRMAVS
ncbi:uncharacterized protein LOC144108530 [Amblyomma americanum]